MTVSAAESPAPVSTLSGLTRPPVNVPETVVPCVSVSRFCPSTQEFYRVHRIKRGQGFHNRGHHGAFLLGIGGVERLRAQVHAGAAVRNIQVIGGALRRNRQQPQRRRLHIVDRAGGQKRQRRLGDALLAGYLHRHRHQVSVAVAIVQGGLLHGHVRLGDRGHLVRHAFVRHLHHRRLRPASGQEQHQRRRAAHQDSFQMLAPELDFPELHAHHSFADEIV